MGTKTDMTRRLTWLRVDNEQTRNWYKSVRDFIFKLGRRPDSNAVKDLGLGKLSLTATQVRVNVLRLFAKR